MKHLRKYNESRDTDRFISEDKPFGEAEELQYQLGEAASILDEYMFYIDAPQEEGGGKNGEGARNAWFDYTQTLKKINELTQKHNQMK